MIQSDYSGVIFTANPTGILNEMVIVAGEGLGCNIVEDKISKQLIITMWMTKTITLKMKTY